VNEFASIQLNKNSDIPVYRQLGDAFCILIERGALKPHRRLPPIRRMANALRINNDTVINAYKYMESRGAVYSIVGSGTYVAPVAGSASSFYPNPCCFQIKAVQSFKRRLPMP
jgi:DNA-binding transcriptional regulator YhcF (GntR family)